MTRRPGQPGLPRAPRTTEAAESAAFFAWVELHAGRYPVLLSVIHVANEGKRAPWIARHMGLSRGVPDVLCFAPGEGGAGLALELKIHPNKPTPEQLEWIDRLRGYGWGAAVVTMRAAGDWTLAAAALVDHLGLPVDLLPAPTRPAPAADTGDGREQRPSCERV